MNSPPRSLQPRSPPPRTCVAAAHEGLCNALLTGLQQLYMTEATQMMQRKTAGHVVESLVRGKLGAESMRQRKALLQLLRLQPPPPLTERRQQPQRTERQLRWRQQYQP